MEFDGIKSIPKDNYKLAYLQISKDIFGCYMPLNKIIELTSESFNKDKTGMLNSAYARYFCIFLEEKGVLSNFYRAMREAKDLSPK